MELLVLPVCCYGGQFFFTCHSFVRIDRIHIQIPTFVLASASINPRLRSDAVFAITFFLTRIGLHVAFGVSLIARRAQVTDGSLGPGIIMACIFPLHVFWFSGSVKTFIKQSVSKRETRVAVVAPDTGKVHGKSSHPIFAHVLTDRPWPMSQSTRPRRPQVHTPPSIYLPAHQASPADARLSAWLFGSVGISSVYPAQEGGSARCSADYVPPYPQGRLCTSM